VILQEGEIMQSSSTLSIAIICGFFLLLLGMVVFAVYVIRKGSAQNAKIAQALGFTPVTDSQLLLQKVAYVNDINHPEMYRVENVYHHHASGGDVYLFGLHRRDIRGRTFSQPSGSSRIHYFPLELSAIAFVSPSWRLPRFNASPRLSGGKLAEIGNSLSEAALDIKQEIIKFPHIPTLDAHYLIGTLETSTSVNLPDGFLRVLAASPNLRLHAGGDTLTLSYNDSNSRTPDEERMKRLYKIGMQLARELQG
jgi:hypothetical protein